MAVYISGGSNSILKGGYADRLLKDPSNADFKTVAIGGTSSITGLYRLLFTEKLNPGDTVLWEYALNDLNQIKKSGCNQMWS